MSWFSTSAFDFELPGEAWEERTVHVFRVPGDARSAFMIGRAKIPPTGRVSLEEILPTLPMGAHDERKILRHETRDVGPLDGDDVSFYARSGTEGQYYRFVSVAYYDLELTFQFTGPMDAREDIDARADETLDSVQFRKRP
jgi:hypothetical protein